MLVDGLGNPIEVRITGGQVHDVTQAVALLAGKSAEFVLGDKAYDADDVLAAIEGMSAAAVIPSRTCRTEPRTIDNHIYKERHLVECFFCHLKHFRRAATRYEKTLSSYLGMILFACILIWLR